MKNRLNSLALSLVLGSLSLSTHAQGLLTPPGAPAPIMKTLTEIEPRTPISSLPFTITNRGSYYLITNLTGSPSFTNGITIKASDVTLDLMGFSLTDGTGDAIAVSDTVTVTNIAVRNGSVRNWSGNGVNTLSGRGSQLERLRVSGDSTGINVGTSTIVNNCTSYGNLGIGIMANNGDTLIDCDVYNNGDNGISTGNGCIISTCTARSNFRGISANPGCTITDCTCYFNHSDGIYASINCTIRGCTTALNTGDGIGVSNNCHVVDNTCNTSGIHGIHITGSNNRIENNHMVANDHGLDVDGTGNLIIRNSASGNTINYVVAASNKVGPIVTAPDSAAISGNIGGSGVGSTDPWANFAF